MQVRKLALLLLLALRRLFSIAAFLVYKPTYDAVPAPVAASMVLGYRACSLCNFLAVTAGEPVRTVFRFLLLECRCYAFPYHYEPPKP